MCSLNRENRSSRPHSSHATPLNANKARGWKHAHATNKINTQSRSACFLVCFLFFFPPCETIVWTFYIQTNQHYNPAFIYSQPASAASSPSHGPTSHRPSSLPPQPPAPQKFPAFTCSGVYSLPKSTLSTDKMWKLTGMLRHSSTTTAAVVYERLRGMGTDTASGLWIS